MRCRFRSASRRRSSTRAARSSTLTDVSVVLGNVVLADQGLSFSAVRLGTVPEPELFIILPDTGDRCSPPATVALPVRYRPSHADSPITQAVPLPMAGAPVTPGIVPLLTAGFVISLDANGYRRAHGCRPTIRGPGRSTSAFAARMRSTRATSISRVVYIPPAARLASRAGDARELSPNLSLTDTDPNYAVDADQYVFAAYSGSGQLYAGRDADGVSRQRPSS